MDNSIVNVPRPPSTTLSVDSTVYQGQNQIRRNIGTFTSLYIGDNIVSRVVALAPGRSLVINEAVIALWIKTTSPLEVTAEAEKVLEFNVNQTLMLDQPLKKITFFNGGQNMASINIDYLSVVSA